MDTEENPDVNSQMKNAIIAATATVAVAVAVRLIVKKLHRPAPVSWAQPATPAE
jgi:hypothetical protein